MGNVTHQSGKGVKGFPPDKSSGKRKREMGGRESGKGGGEEAEREAGYLKACGVYKDRENKVENKKKLKLLLLGSGGHPSPWDRGPGTQHLLCRAHPSRAQVRPIVLSQQYQCVTKPTQGRSEGPRLVSCSAVTILQFLLISKHAAHIFILHLP